MPKVAAMSNVFETGVVIHLVDRVSAALGTIARSMATTNTACAALNARLQLINTRFTRGLVLAGGGMALAAPLISATKEAEKYQHQLNQMRSAGMGVAEMSSAIGAAWSTSSKVITSGVTENLKVISDLRTITGNTKDAITFTPKFAKMQGAYASVLDGKLSKRSEELSFGAMKALDQIGQIENLPQISNGLDKMMKATVASLGRVVPTDFQNAWRFARQARFGYTDDFRYKVLPELILENKTIGGGSGSGGVGPMLNAGYKAVVQGVLNRVSAGKLASLGLVPLGSILKTSTTGTTLQGGLLNKELFARNPLEWVKQEFIPRLAKANHIDPNDRDKLVQASNQVFKGNGMLGSFIGELIKKQLQFERFGHLYDKADGIDAAYDRGQKNDPMANWKALHASFENLKVSIGEHILPVLIPMVNKLATGIQKAASYLHDHPGITKAIAGVTALASGLLVLGGVASMVSAGVAGLQFVGAAIGAALAPEIFITVAVAATALATVIKNWDKIMEYVRSHQKQLIVVAAALAVSLNALGTALTWLKDICVGVVSGIVNSITGLVNFAAKMPGTSVWMYSELGKMFDKWNVGDSLYNASKSYLSQSGLGQVTNAIEAPAHWKKVTDQVFSPGLRPAYAGTMTINNTFNVPAGTDTKEVSKHVTKELGKQLGKTFGNLNTSQRASGGGSTGTSFNGGGRVRP